MKAITLRNIPGAVAQAIEMKAREMHSSINRAVVRLLEERTGVVPDGKKARGFHDLDSLAGRWSAKEAAVFERAFSKGRQIDEELWK